MNARLAGCAAALLLAGCAVVPAPLPELSGVPAAFELSGRLAVRQADRSEIARLRWTHRQGADLWIVASPLGNEVARIESDGGGARLIQAGGEARTAPSFAALTHALLGVALEPALLAAWLHGGAPGDAPSGWSVTVDEKQPAGAIEIARRISATRGDVVVRLVVDEYRALAE
ncbi:MAG TPA: outer membrane lipoprotein LolB [Usitatibacter sp.]|nr:outer membrane lipoprotein LolB [Usitatibacter sp.]